MSDEFKLGDLVWAKMKGFRPWPGRIAKPRANLKKPAKKTGVQCIYFYGSNDYAWIDNINIKPYMALKKTLINSSKSVAFKQAVNDIEEYIKKKESDPNFDPEATDGLDDDFDKLRDEEEEEEVATPAKKPKKSIKRASSTTKSLSAKKKRMSSPEENGSSPSYTSNHVKNYNEILNRPSIGDVPDAALVDLNNVSDNLKSKKIVPSSKVFGFLGLGIMGSGIVKNLINSGHKVNIWNRTSEKAENIKAQADINHSGQVETYKTPNDIMHNSDIIFCCVSDPATVKELVYGNCGVLDKNELLDGKGYVEMTSIDSETSIGLSNFISGKGGRYLEAQLQGSKQEADEGNLIVLGAGNKELFDDCESCFKAIGKMLFYLGDVGFASKMNMALQVMKGVALVGVAEGLALADRSGISPKDVLDVFSLTSLSSPFLKSKAELIVSMDFQDVQQPLMHMQKDMRLALELADTLKQPLLMASTANEVYKHVRRLGYDSHDAACVFMRSRY